MTKRHPCITYGALLGAFFAVLGMLLGIDTQALAQAQDVAAAAPADPSLEWAKALGLPTTLGGLGTLLGVMLGRGGLPLKLALSDGPVPLTVQLATEDRELLKRAVRITERRFDRDQTDPRAGTTP